MKNNQMYVYVYKVSKGVQGIEVTLIGFRMGVELSLGILGEPLLVSLA